MLKIKKIGGSETVVMTGEFDILFSYETPVAAIQRKSGAGLRTSTRWSQTTTRHINKFLHGNAKTVQEVSQEMIEAIPVGTL